MDRKETTAAALKTGSPLNYHLERNYDNRPRVTCPFYVVHEAVAMLSPLMFLGGDRQRRPKEECSCSCRIRYQFTWHGIMTFLSSVQAGGGDWGGPHGFWKRQFCMSSWSVWPQVSFCCTVQLYLWFWYLLGSSEQNPSGQQQWEKSFKDSLPGFLLL